MATREAVSFSSVYGAGFEASNAIDGSYSTHFASAAGSSNWLSVQVPTNTRIGYVAIHNRRDNYAYLMGSVQVWLGSYHHHLLGHHPGAAFAAHRICFSR